MDIRIKITTCGTSALALVRALDETRVMFRRYKLELRPDCIPGLLDLELAHQMAVHSFRDSLRRAGLRPACTMRQLALPLPIVFQSDDVHKNPPSDAPWNEDAHVPQRDRLIEPIPDTDEPWPNCIRED